MNGSISSIMRNGLQHLLQLARLAVSTHAIVYTCVIVTWLLRPMSHGHHTWPSEITILKVWGKKKEKMRIGPWTWHSSNNDTLIFPLINKWQENAKDTNWESLWSGPSTVASCQGHCRVGGRACIGVQLPESAFSFPSSSTCFCGTGQGQHGHTWCFELVTLTMMCQRS